MVNEIRDNLNKLSKETLIKLVINMRVTNDNSYLYEQIPESHSMESTYKDAIYAGMIDADMELSQVPNTLANVVIDGWNITLDGDPISLKPKYKRIDMKVKQKWSINGTIKTEVLMHMIHAYKSIDLGEYEGWTRTLVQYKEHTLVVGINTNGMYSSLKLLKDDRIAKEMYTKQYRNDTVEWSKVDLHDKVYGDMEVGIPHAYDDVVERMYTALEFLEDLQRQDPVMGDIIRETLTD